MTRSFSLNFRLARAPRVCCIGRHAWLWSSQSAFDLESEGEAAPSYLAVKSHVRRCCAPWLKNTSNQPRWRRRHSSTSCLPRSTTFPLVTKLLLGHASVCEALLRPEGVLRRKPPTPHPQTPPPAKQSFAPAGVARQEPGHEGIYSGGRHFDGVEMPRQSGQLPRQFAGLPECGRGVPDQFGRLPGQSARLPRQFWRLPGVEPRLPGQSGRLPDQRGRLPRSADGLPRSADGLPRSADGLPGRQGVGRAWVGGAGAIFSDTRAGGSSGGGPHAIHLPGV
jgi:hypothetical protein